MGVSPPRVKRSTHPGRSDSAPSTSSRTAEWTDVDWRSVGNIAMFGGAPVDQLARTDYFESLHYCAAVVGITTSAFLEAAVVGRPVMSFS